MTAVLRFGFAAAAAWLALAPVPLAAQNAASPVAVTPSAQSDTAIGPAALEDFSLDGTVIRRADPAPERSAPPARQQQPAPATTAARQSSEPAPVRAQPEQRRAEREQRPQPGTSQAGNQAARASAPLDLGAPSPTGTLFTPAPALTGATAPDGSSFAPAPAQSFPEAPSGFSPLPWLLAIVLLGGGAFFYFRRQRPGLAFAGGPEVSAFAVPDPAPGPRPQPPAAAPAPVPAPAPPIAPVGIVSTRIRPWLDLQFRAEKVVLDDDRALVEFEILVENSGSAPAREILVEAAMFNAGPEQDKQLGAFVARPVGQGERVPLLPPLKSMAFRSAVHLSREQLKQFKAGDRLVFVPLVALNVLYRWSGGDSQTSATYLVGKQTKGEKLAPFRCDQGPSTFATVSARELDVRVRK